MAARNDIGALPEGRRNDGLMRLGGAMRRKGASLEEIERELLKHNGRRCQPPLTGEEVSRIAMSVASYPSGGPDPLDAAWQAIEAQPYESNFARFVTLARHLQTIRPGQPVALPVDRIGKLMGVHWTTVGLYRQQAVRDGVLELADKYVAHRRAGTFLVALDPQEQRLSLETLTSSSTTGLLRIFGNFPSENQSSVPSENECGKMETIERNAQVLRLAARNFRVFPCKPHDKTPLVRWKTAATSNVEQIEQWLAKWPKANWAVATGKVSQVLALDIDRAEGLQSFVACCEQAGVDWRAIAEATLGVKTGNGTHLYFAHPGHVIHNSSQKGAPGLDIRGDGGYCVAPPSMHENGEPYFWLGGDEAKPITTAAEWLLEWVVG